MWSPTGDVASFAQRERRILVPHDQPVVGTRLVEQRGAKRYRIGTDKTCCDHHESGVARKLLDDWDVHQVPSTGAASFEYRMLEHTRNIRSLGLIQDARHDLEAVCHAHDEFNEGAFATMNVGSSPLGPSTISKLGPSTRQNERHWR